MTSPSATMPASDSKNPSVSFESFAEALLEPWLGDAQQCEGPSIADPRIAAAMACYQATIVHAKARGTVLIAAADGSLARSCLDYLRTFFEDQPQLSALVKQIRSDEILLHGHRRILVTTSPRRPRDLLTQIALAHRPTPAVDAQERKLIRSSLADWARFKGFEPAKHHLLIINEIEQFLASDDEVLLLFAPPGSAKSTYVSVLLPSWHLANNPSHSILAATHNEEFSERWGRRIRNDIALDGKLLGIELADESKAAARWSLTTGGEYFAVGAGVGISGYRADLGIIDDLFGKREDAYSETVRQKRWEWYVDDFSARLKPGAKRILMNTRWHEEDVAGKVLEQIERGEIKGRIISIPAIAEADDPLGRAPGEYLWDEPPYNYGSFLRARQRETSPMMWAALYQQRPAPEEGDYFRADWLKPYDAPPARETLRTYGASDYAVTAGGGDYTTHVIVALDPQGHMYLLDLWRKRAASDEWIEVFCDMVLKWKPLGWAEERGQISAGVGPALDRRQRERHAWCARKQFPTRGDKAVRAQSIRGRMALEGLHVPVNASWYPTLRSELLSFPAGKHDDQVDALGLVGQLLDTMVRGTAPDLRKQRPIDAKPTFNEAFARHRRLLSQLRDDGICPTKEN